MNRWELLHADCRAVMANMGDATVDSVVTDPPYHLTSIVKRFGPDGAAPAQYGTEGAYARASRGFMGQQWDGGAVAFDPALWAEVLRVLKPGGHLLAFSGSRTYHRMACAIEDAGFEIRDQIMWLYGSGFPKSHDVSKGIDKAAGAERTEVVGTKLGRPGMSKDGSNQRNGFDSAFGGEMSGIMPSDILAPATDAARQWEGWGTALKPAHEPIVLARKPLIGTVAGNVLAHGTGGLNIDGCRVAGDVPSTTQGGKAGGGFDIGSSDGSRHTEFVPHGAGRFPANVMHDGSDEVVAGFPDTASNARSSKGKTGAANSTGILAGGHRRGDANAPDDSGSAARFFYCAKASKADRDEGCVALPEHDWSGDGAAVPERERRPFNPSRNHHPTVKPTALMRYLTRLITPPGGLVFDPFAGSGSTGKAAMLEGFRFLGAEMTAEYIPIARARIAAAAGD